MDAGGVLEEGFGSKDEGEGWERGEGFVALFRVVRVIHDVGVHLTLTKGFLTVPD